MAQFALSIKYAKEIKYWKQQGIMLFDAEKTSKYMIMKGNQQIHNNKGLLNTFRSLCRRCSVSVLADCSPRILYDLSFKRMIMYSMAISTNGIKMNTTKNATKLLLKEKVSPKTSFHSILHSNLPGYSTNFMRKRYGENTASAMIQVMRMKNGHSFELMGEERRGNTTAPNRSTLIRARLWIDTRPGACVKKKPCLHKTWSRVLDIEPLYRHRDQENWVQQIGHGHVYDWKVDGFSHGFRLINNYFDDSVPSQRDKKNQAVKYIAVNSFSVLCNTLSSGLVT